MAKLKTGPKVALAVLGIGAAIYGARYYVVNHGSAKQQSTVPVAPTQLAGFEETTTSGTGNSTFALPESTPAPMSGTPIKMLVIPWNAQMGLALANGGPATTKGSLMQKYGVNLAIERQDDYGKMQEAMVACATQLSKGAKTCTNGANFVTIMGDAGPAFFAGLNDQLTKLGGEYRAEIVGSAGRSFGEDKFMAPQSVKSDAKQGRGLLIAGVLKDGDWNIAIFWAAQNEICNNPDVTTFDPDCLNWVGTSSFVEADEKYIQGACEERPVVSKGKKTGETKRVCVNAVVTWTPGDVAVAQKKGGLVSVLSTRENGSQMANVIIGIRKWNRENRGTVKSMLKATFEGGDQIKRGGQPVLMRAAKASAEIYKEETPAYWAKYYRGVEEADAQGNLVPLGGSRVFTLADNMRYYGLEPGSANAYAAAYKLFGDFAKQQYPKDLPTYPAVEEVVDTSYIRELAAEGTAQGTADAPTFTDPAGATETLGKHSWRITFETASASFGPGATKELDQLLATLAVASETYVEIHGHTDNQGNPSYNQSLSEQRARAVQKYLETNAPKNFPTGRIKTVIGHGQSDPVASNGTNEGRALNRRVDIVLKSNR